jgi:hypothetical protein
MKDKRKGIKREKEKNKKKKRKGKYEKRKKVRRIMNILPSYPPSTLRRHCFAKLFSKTVSDFPENLLHVGILFTLCQV